jgi:hypothetical protein
MKIILDTCVWGGSRQQLEIAGHDAIWTGDWPEDPATKRFFLVHIMRVVF